MRGIRGVIVFAVASLWACVGWAGQRVIITFKSGTSFAARDRVLSGLQARRVVSIESNGNSDEEFVAEVADLDQPPAKAALGEGVVSIEKDYRTKWIEQSEKFSFQATPFPDATLNANGLQKFVSSISQSAARGEIPWGVRRVKAPSAWSVTEGAGVKVAVVDTGINFSHPDLTDNVAGGFNALTDVQVDNVVMNGEQVMDGNGHGTHVAGTIAAVRDGKGVVGVAPRAQLYAVKVLDEDGSGALSDVIKGIIWCANNDIQVANLSLGTAKPSETMERALKYAKARGVVVVAAAGNASGGPVSYPGAYPETISVSASDWQDHLASFSSKGPEVKFIAPGASILSSSVKGDFVSLSGTSMAAPHVAGLAALAVALGYRGLDGPDGVLQQLRRAATPIAGLDAAEQGAGMIDAEKLVR